MSSTDTVQIGNIISDINQLAYLAAGLAAAITIQAKPTPARKSRPPIRETITYPQVKPVTEINNSCLEPAMASEHILFCGHIITTVTPNEPCAPNCHHVFTAHDQNIMMMRSAQLRSQIIEKDFYCDACVESEFEARIHIDITSEAAEEKRSVMRKEEARRRGKNERFRKCYIVYKCTVVPCRADGTVSKRYVPSGEGHVFDRAVPRTGGNMFEDLDGDGEQEGEDEE